MRERAEAPRRLTKATIGGCPVPRCPNLCEDLRLRRESAEPLQEQIVAFLRDSIRHGRIDAGRRLPSSRRLAAAQRVSRTTVVEAYERLAAEGYIVSRPRKGVFVAVPHATAAARERRPARRRVPAASRDTTWAGAPEEFALPLAPGVPAVDRFPFDLWTHLSARLARSRAFELIGWADPRGELELREAIAEHVASARGIHCTAEQIIVASGSQPIVEMLVRAVAVPGASVWFEEPGEPASRAVLAALGLKPEPVPVDEQGLDVDAGVHAAPLARLALVAPSHHYPLGFTMSLERRRALVAWAARRRAFVIENEIDADYRFVPCVRPTLYSLDRAGRVIYLGSFNKALAPGLRVGYAVLPADVADALPVISPTVSVPNQLVLARFLSEGHFACHRDTLRGLHAERREALLASLEDEARGLLRCGEPPEAGLRLPVSLPSDLADDVLPGACLDAGIKVGRALSSCYAGRRNRAPGLTLGFASTPEPRIAPAVRALAGIIRCARRSAHRQ